MSTSTIPTSYVTVDGSLLAKAIAWLSARVVAQRPTAVVIENAEDLRSYAGRIAESDPSLAADLFAAADRSEHKASLAK